MGGKQSQIKKHPEFSRAGITIEGVLQKLSVPMDNSFLGKLVSKQEGGTWKDRYFKLDNKKLGYWKWSPKSKPMRNYTIIDRDFKIIDEDPEDHTIVLQCISRINNRQLKWRIRTESYATYSAWLHMIKLAQRPIWDPITLRTCRTCSAKFTISKRQHHCRNWGRAVCAQCSPHRHQLGYLGYEKAQRVCERCIWSLQSMEEIEKAETRSLYVGTTQDSRDHDRAMFEARCSLLVGQAPNFPTNWKTTTSTKSVGHYSRIAQKIY